MCIPTLRRTSLLLLLALFIMPAVALAQVTVGADFMSRYVWRGQDFGESFSVQPALEYSRGPLSIGTWASYSMAADGATANEHDLYAGLSFGPVSVGVTDYYFPSGAPAYLDYFSEEAVTSPDFFDEDSHTIEPYASYSGPEAFPVSLYGAINATNDPDNSIYLEVSYPFTVQGVNLGLTAGMTPAEGIYADELAFVNLGLSAGKSIPVTDTFTLPVGVSYIINPYAERTFLVFGFSLST